MTDIRLRPFRLEDADRLFEIESQPRMVEFQDFEARTRESSLDYIQRAIAAIDEDPRSWHEYAIADASDLLIGRVGSWIEEGTAWLWYAVDPARQGQGIARFALTQLLPLLPTATLKLECDPRNVPSCRVAEGLGFEMESESEIIVRSEPAPSRVYILRSGDYGKFPKCHTQHSYGDSFSI